MILEVQVRLEEGWPVFLQVTFDGKISSLSLTQVEFLKNKNYLVSRQKILTSFFLLKKKNCTKVGFGCL